jgi:hypothetical protein
MALAERIVAFEEAEQEAVTMKNRKGVPKKIRADLGNERAIRVMYGALMQVGMVVSDISEYSTVAHTKATKRAKEIVEATLMEMNTNHTRAVQRALGIGGK